MNCDCYHENAGDWRLPPRLVPCALHTRWLNDQTRLRSNERYAEKCFYSTKADGAEFIELRNFPIETELVVDRYEYGPRSSRAPAITCTLHVRDRDKPEVIRIQRSSSLWETDAAALAKQTLHLIKQQVMHEIDECFFVNGVRYGNPDREHG